MAAAAAVEAPAVRVEVQVVLEAVHAAAEVDAAVVGVVAVDAAGAAELPITGFVRLAPENSSCVTTFTRTNSPRQHGFEIGLCSDKKL